MLALAATALTARAVGPASYGILALVLTYARAVERLVTFESWQPLIKYGAALGEPEHRPDLKQLLKFGLVIDISAALAAWAIAILIALAARPLFGWDGATQHLILLFCTVLPFNLTGTPSAIMRLSGRYRMTAYGPVVGAVARLIACIVGVWMGFSLFGFAMIWMATQIIGRFSVLWIAWRQLRMQELGDFWKVPLKGVTARFPGLWGFAWSSNLSQTIRSSAQEYDTLLVGWLAGPAAAGLYHIAKRVGRLLLEVSVQVQAVLYPDVARLWAEGAIDKMRRAVMQVEVMLFAFGAAGVIGLIFLAEPFLRWTAGPEFLGAGPLLVVQMIAVTMTMSGSAARSALLAMGRQQQVLKNVLVATLAFHITAIVLIPRIGAMGANIAHVVLGTIWCAGMALEFRRALKESRDRPFEQAPAAAE